MLYLPKDYKKTGTSSPLMIFLHGMGERGEYLESIKKVGPPKLIESGKEIPFIVVSPQWPDKSGWKADKLKSLFDDVVSKYNVDKDRVYLTGISMGGFGTWTFATSNPELFAAIVPICGGGNPKEADKIKNLPIWIFHGAKDVTVKPERSEEMYKALQKAGAKEVKLTIYPNAGHDSWSETYNNDEVYNWLLKQKKTSAKKQN
ncbi:MAG: phospholipase [Lentisphaerae bacterium GWF2_49_21]|nr:MAG: phospholipase [Lentisphaerae bacterium GWF2_49_21]